jgi:hypothetical protein
MLILYLLFQVSFIFKFIYLSDISTSLIQRIIVSPSNPITFTANTNYTISHLSADPNYYGSNLITILEGISFIESRDSLGQNDSTFTQSLTRWELRNEIVQLDKYFSSLLGIPDNSITEVFISFILIILLGKMDFN